MKAFPIVVSLIAAYFSCHASPPAPSNHKTTAVRAEDAGTPFGIHPSIGDVALEEDAPGETSFRYTHYNEVENYLFEACLEPGGAFISVGTFRGLNIASSGRVQRLIQLDYNDGVKLFNLMNLKLISLSKDRVEYLSLLLTGERETELMEKARTGKLTPKQYMEALKASFQKKHPTAKGVLTRKWKELGVSLPPEQWTVVDQINAGDGLDHLEHFMHNKMFNYLKQTSDEEMARYTIFGNDARFQTIQKMIAENRVLAMVGDLTGEKSLASVGKALKASHLFVSGIDVSNVPDYFAEMEVPAAQGGTAKEGEDGLAAFIAMRNNIKKLPLNEKSRVLLTAVAPSPAQGLGWNYFSLSEKQFPEWEECYRRIRAHKGPNPLKLETALRSFLHADPSAPATKPILFSPAGAKCSANEGDKP